MKLLVNVSQHLRTATNSLHVVGSSRSQIQGQYSYQHNVTINMLSELGIVKARQTEFAVYCHCPHGIFRFSQNLIGQGLSAKG